ncbi:MAG: hypothetical protein J0M15_13235 [Deltaproteobacteria bacterium]|jgi:hypothetical protein|nr:hypothetical protein [Deltaproteobacteria bacterium]
MKAERIFHQKMFLKHSEGARLAIFEFAIFSVGKSKNYISGYKYRAWLSEDGKTIFGFDNHSPKGPHLHIGEKEVGYVYRGLVELKKDIIEMIRMEGFLYED